MKDQTGSGDRPQTAWTQDHVQSFRPVVSRHAKALKPGYQNMSCRTPLETKTAVYSPMRTSDRRVEPMSLSDGYGADVQGCGGDDG